jgi:hypothetical protein
MRIGTLTHFLLWIPFLCWGIDVKPWINNEYEVEIRTELLCQHFNSVQIPHHDLKRNESDYFLSLSAAFPFRRYRGEFEITGAQTHHQNHRIDNFRISFAYSAMDDREGDPFSLMGGMILSEPLSRALHDISSFHHGHLNAEFFLSVGKDIEFLCDDDNLFRWWNVCGLGCTDFGASWIREDCACEWRQEVQYIRLFANTLWGLGKRDLRLNCFKGYGPIQHRSVDIGIRYGCCFSGIGTLSVQYARRVYAHNFPENANLILFEYYLPFGSQDPSTY